MEMLVHSLSNWVLNNHPYAGTVFGIIGMLVTIVTALDKLLPSLGISKKLEVVFSIPFVGTFINYCL